MRRSHAIVSGRVQGVGYRLSCVRQAEALGVAGWVRNLPDGTVEAVLEGEDDAVAGALRWLHDGPSGARVERVEVRDEEPLGEQGFTQR
ncbi:acylphosphatase [Georgenia sunbinii]|uniref:acylphosphatase n=1 Tax=Georgenia sunbinii TaxID=3117728 RepID=UPI002F266D1E